MVNRQRILHSFLSSFLFLALLAGFLPGPFSAKKVSAADSGALLKGDVTQDGLVDGRDVLKLLRILEKIDTPLSDETATGDVYPLNETGEQLTGDSQLTTDDAELLLRQTVGLVSPGEISGDFSSSEPSIEKFEPMSGASGTQVGIYGTNFVEGLPEENLVRFGDTPASIVSATGTKVVVEVPPGAESGYVTVMTPGGQARSLVEFEVVTRVSGQVALPSGEDTTQFTVISPFGETAIDSGGSFTVDVKQDGLTFIGAAPKSGGENVYLNMLPPGETTRGTGDIEISPLTTAKTLVWLQPFFLSDSLSRQQELWDIMDTLPEITALASMVELVYPENETPLEDTRITTALEAATIALFNALPDDYKVSVNVVGDKSRSPGGTGLSSGDLYIIQVEPGEDELSVGSVNGNPLDWVIQMHQLNPEDFPEGINDSEALSKAVHERTGYNDYTTVSANFWSLKLALVTSVCNYLFGLAKPDLGLTLAEDDDAVYILRAYSGALVDSSPDDIDSAVINSLLSKDGTVLGMNRHEFRALTSNLIQATLDSMDLLVSTEGVKETLIKAGVIGFEASFTQQFPYGTSGMSNTEIVERAWTVVNDTLAKMTTEFILYLKDASWKSTLMTVFKSVVKKVAIFEQISTAGKIAERIAGLCGTSIGSLVGADSSPTPLESAFIVTGDPFGPKITTFSPTYALGGTEVVITGERFSEEPDGNQVFFELFSESNPAKVISASKTELRVQVPPGKGRYNIKVKTSLGTAVSEDSFTIIRTPKITGIEKSYGYMASNDFAGGVYPGTQLDIYGDYLRTDPPADRVTFNGITAEIVYDHNAGRLTVRVPAGIEGGTPSSTPLGPSGRIVDIRIVADETGGISNAVPFLIIDPPLIERAAPTELKGSDRASITGANFPSITGEIKVKLEFDGQVQYIFPGVANWHSAIFIMNAYIPEGTTGTMCIETPAGSSNKVNFTRIPGLAEGAKIPVQITGMDVIPDGQISFVEAVMFAAGELDALAEPWDDSSWKVLEHWYLDEPIPGEIQEWKHQPAEDERINLGPSGELSGTYLDYIEYEFYYKVEHPWPYDPETVQESSAPYRNICLDDNEHGGLEEADYIWFTGGENRIGSGYADTVYFSDDFGLTSSDIFEPFDSVSLNAGYDTITSDIGICTLQGNIVLSSPGNTVRNVTITNPGGNGLSVNSDRNIFAGTVRNCSGNGVIVTGNNNDLGIDYGVLEISECSSHGLVVNGNGNHISDVIVTGCGGNGILINGGLDNYIQINENHSHSGHGLEVTGGSAGNFYYQYAAVGSTYNNTGYGFYIHGAGTEYNRVTGNVGYFSATEYRENLNHGVVISEGACFNTVDSRISGCRGNGVLITGQATERNTVQGVSWLNRDYGVHVTSGASFNVISSKTKNNGLDNIRIDGNSNDNELRDAEAFFKDDFIPNGSGIRIIGDGQGQTTGTVLTRTATGGGTYGLWVSGVVNPDAGEEYGGGNSGPSLSVDERCSFGTTTSNYGIRLDDGTRHADIIGLQVLVTGSKTAWNHVSTVYAYVYYGDIGIHITEGSHHNLIDNFSEDIWFKESPANQDGSGTTGIIIDGGAHNNHVEGIEMGISIEGQPALHSNGIIIDGAGDNKITNVSIANFDTGITVRNSTGTVVAGDFDIWYCNRGILLDGVTDCAVGAAADNLNIITSAQDFGIKVTGSSDNVTLQKLDIQAKDRWGEKPAGEYGIIVDGGSHDIQVGVAAPGAENYISGAVRDALLIQGPGTTRVNVYNNNFGINTIEIFEGGGGEAASISMEAGVTDESFFTDRSSAPLSRVPQPNLENGINVNNGATDIRIGGRNFRQDNLLVNNLAAGIVVAGTATRVAITGNYIGIDRDMAQEMPNYYGIALQNGVSRTRISGNNICCNAEDGISVSGGANNNQISGNLIMDNARYGVRVDGAASLNNNLRSNTITANGDAGIRLTGGGNDLIPPPVIDRVSFEGGRIDGYIDSSLPRGCVVDVYADTDDEGEYLLGSDIVYGNRFSIRAEIPSTMVLHAIVTDPDGNTSEFGNFTPSEGAKSTPSGYVFTSTRDGNSEIYIHESGSTTPERLTEQEAADCTPRLSPDGSRILFVSERIGTPGIWVMNRDGTGQVPYLTGSAASYDPAWSPDGNSLAFVSEKDGNAEIYRYAAPGYGTITLGYDDGTADGGSYNMDTGYVHALHLTGGTGRLSQLQFYIYRYPATFEWQISNWDSNLPGNTIIASGTATPSETGWYTVNLDNVAVPADFVVGMKYLSSSSPTMGIDYDSDCEHSWVYKPESGWTQWNTYSHFMIRAIVPPPDALRLTENDDTDDSPAWSPDGTRIAFTSDRSGNRDIWVMNADGTSPVQLTNDSAADYQPAWSPDGTRIAFVSERDGNPEIYIVTLADSSLTRLTGNPAIDTDPAWQDDGSRIMFASDRQGGMELYSIAPNALSLSRWTTSLGANSEPHLSLYGTVTKSRSFTSYRLPNSLSVLSMPIRSRETASPAEGTRQISLTREGADGLAVSVQSVTASPGTEVSVTVNLTGAEDLGNLAFDLAYDGLNLTLLAVTPGEMLDAGMYAFNPENLPSNSGSFRFNWVTTAGYTGSGTIVTLRFRVADGLENGETIALPLSNLMTASRDIVELPRSGENGLITLFVQQAMVTGTTWQVNGTILGEVTLTLDGGTMFTSNESGSYQLGISTLGEHIVNASKAGYQNQEQTVNVTDVTGTYTLNFKGDNGLIPNAPDLSYVLACINKWSYPPSDGTELEMPKVLAVINRWKYPILTNPD